MNAEREKAILQIAIRQKRVTVSELAKTLYASEPSIRRDLNSLEKQQLLRRVHGGAVLSEKALDVKIPFLVRELEKADEKVIIARRAAEMISDGDVVFLDSSTSAYNIVPFLKQKKNLTVITNGIRTLEKLCETEIDCIGTGGRVIERCMAFVGEEAVQAVARYNADFCFFACRGLTDNGQLTDISEYEDIVRRKMIEYAKKSYLLCTSDRRGKKHYHNLCNVSEITGIISAEGENSTVTETKGQK